MSMQHVELGHLTPEEVQLVLNSRTEKIRTEAYKQGLVAAFHKCQEWANECDGGSGKGGEGYRNLGEAILRIDPSKGY